MGLWRELCHWQEIISGDFEHFEHTCSKYKQDFEVLQSGVNTKPAGLLLNKKPWLRCGERAELLLGNMLETKSVLCSLLSWSHLTAHGKITHIQTLISIPFSWTNCYFIHPIFHFSWSDIFLQFLISISLVSINVHLVFHLLVNISGQILPGGNYFSPIWLRKQNLSLGISPAWLCATRC